MLWRIWYLSIYFSKVCTFISILFPFHENPCRNFRALARKLKGQSINTSRGRPRVISSYSFETIVEKDKINTMSKNSSTRATIRQKIEETRRADLIKCGGNTFTLLEPPSSRTIRRLLQSYYEKCLKPSITTSRRIEALSDFFNFISNATILKAALQCDSEFPNGRVASEYIYNMDATSQMIGETSDVTVFVPKGLKKELASRNRSVSREADNNQEGKKRSVKTHYLTNAIGNLVCAVHVIRDRFDEICWRSNSLT